MSQQEPNPELKSRGPGRNRPKGNKKKNNGPAIKSVLDELLKLKNEFQNIKKGPKEAIEEYKSNPNFTASVDNIVVKPMRRELAALEKAVGEKFLNTHKEFSDSKSPLEKLRIASVVYADDLGSVLRIAAPYAKQALSSLVTTYGPSLLDWLYNRAKGAFSKSHGSGQGLMVNNSPQFGYVDANTVDNKFLAGILFPEDFKTPMIDSTGPSVATTTKMMVLDLFSGADGNSVLHLCPDAAFCPSTMGNCYIAQNTIGSNYNVTTGVCSAYQAIAGPFNGAIPSINVYRVVASSFRFVPNLSAVNNSGVVSVFYNNVASNNTIGTTNPVYAYTPLLQYQSVHIAAINGTKELRQIHIPHAAADLTLDPSASTLGNLGTDGFEHYCIIGSGLPINVTYGKLYITVTIDFIPGDNLMGIVETKFPPDAPGSLACITSIFKKFPHCANMDFDEAQKVAESIMSMPNLSYGPLLQNFASLMAHVKPKRRDDIGGGGGAGQTIGNISFDMIDE